MQFKEWLEKRRDVFEELQAEIRSETGTELSMVLEQIMACAYADGYWDGFDSVLTQLVKMKGAGVLLWRRHPWGKGAMTSMIPYG